MATHIVKHAATQLKVAHGPDVVVHHVCYDELLFAPGPGTDEKAASVALSGFDQDAWHKSRQKAVDLVHRLHAERSETRMTVIVIDDNMQYRSMRHTFYQMARSRQCRFLQLYVDISLEDALARNARRRGSCDNCS